MLAIIKPKKKLHTKIGCEPNRPITIDDNSAIEKRIPVNKKTRNVPFICFQKGFKPSLNKVLSAERLIESMVEINSS